MCDNFVFDWIKTYFNKPDLKEKSLKPVLHFSLLWNLFEHTYFTDDKQLRAKRLLDLSVVSFNKLTQTQLDDAFNFFKSRYFPNNSLDQRFTKLKLDPRNHNGQPSNSEFCKTTLTAINANNCDKTKTLFLIIHRFRNNLFHGRKNPETLNIFEQPFKEIHKFLIHYIETTSDDNTTNNSRNIQ